jgi:hypothetical protein
VQVDAIERGDDDSKKQLDCNDANGDGLAQADPIDSGVHGELSILVQENDGEERSVHRMDARCLYSR